MVPTVLMERYPRIANLVAANWKEQAAFHRYMQTLLVDERGNRRGFPTEIKEELIRLRTYYYLGDIRMGARAETAGAPPMAKQSAGAR